MALKIAMIGAGSIGFTRTLMRDILAVPELADTTFAFTDISNRNLDMVTQICKRDIETNKLPVNGHTREDAPAANSRHRQSSWQCQAFVESSPAHPGSSDWKRQV